MTMKRSFFERLSGSSPADDPFDSFDDEMPIVTAPAQSQSSRRSNDDAIRSRIAEDNPHSGEGQLPVDVHQTTSDITIRAFVAGVRPDELSISISRDMVEIEGNRSEREQIANADYFTRELFWGSFSRSIVLPQEVDVEASSASAKDGLLTIILPKLDKAKQTKLRVKAG
ncbi:MAG TPA: Hsp20/alpha crystallin family protein [Candidatus Paceibacterota bacterium]|nr:Hsp20/alpha crystallin family protein [Candidatus Paceibacterota bacterium]